MTAPEALTGAFGSPGGGYRTSVGVRWSDLDLNGHVNNARVFTLLEEARIAWRAQLADVPPVDNAHRSVVASVQLDYLRPIVHGFDVHFEIIISRIGTKSYTLSYAGSQDGREVLKASTVIVPLEDDGSTARALSQTEKQALARYQVSAESLTDQPVSD